MSEHNQTVNAEIPPPVAMLQLIGGFWVSRALYIAAKLGSADLVQDQSRTATELAAVTGTPPPSLYRVLRALASVGVFAEDGHGRFALTPLTATLRSDVPGSLRAWATLQLGGEHYQLETLLEKKKSGTFSSQEDREYKAICDLDTALSWLNRLAREEQNH